MVRRQQQQYRPRGAARRRRRRRGRGVVHLPPGLGPGCWRQQGGWRCYPGVVVGIFMALMIWGRTMAGGGGGRTTADPRSHPALDQREPPAFLFPPTWRRPSRGVLTQPSASPPPPRRRGSCLSHPATRLVLVSEYLDMSDLSFRVASPVSPPLCSFFFFFSVLQPRLFFFGVHVFTAWRSGWGGGGGLQKGTLGFDSKTKSIFFCIAVLGSLGNLD